MNAGFRNSLGIEGVLDGRQAEVVELPLLLPGWQVSALESAAHSRGMTAAEMVRHLVRTFIAGQPGHVPGRPAAAHG